LPEKKPTLSQAYYGGTQVAVKFFIVSFLLFCQFIPVILGLGVYLIATVDSTLPPSTIELVLLGLVAIIIMAPSFYWLTRSLLGIIVVVDKVQRPLASLRQSRSLVKGYFKPVAGRLIVLVLVMFVGLLPQTLTGYIAHPVAALAASSLWQLVTVAILLPVTYLYLIRIYRALSA
jgi:hypothetical protein